MAIEILCFDQDFILLRSQADQSLIPLAAAIYHAHLPFAEEVIGSDKEICIKLKAEFDELAIKQLCSLELTDDSEKTNYRLPIYFGEGKDWAFITSQTGKTKQEVILDLTSSSFTFHNHGFLPGFLYVTGLPDYLHLPRKVVPDKHISPGSLAIGSHYLGLYSIPSPGGWHIIGSCPLTIFDPTDNPPVCLKPGDALRLYEIDGAEYERLSTINSKLKHYG